MGVGSGGWEQASNSAAAMASAVRAQARFIFLSPVGPNPPFKVGGKGDELLSEVAGMHPAGDGFLPRIEYGAGSTRERRRWGIWVGMFNCPSVGEVG